MVGEVLEHGVAGAAVTGRDAERVEAREDVELRDRERREPVEPRRVAERDEVEPPAAALAPGRRPVLVALVAQVAADLVVELGRERAGADPRRVGLADPPDRGDVGRADAGADAGRAGDGVRRGDERIRAVVEVEQGRLGALEQDLLTGVERLPAEAGGVGDVRLEPVPHPQVLLGHRMEVEPRVARPRAQHLLLRLERGGDLLAQDLRVEHVLDADPEPRRLVGVAGADAALRRPDLELAELRLAGGVEEHVVGHDQVRVRGDPQRADVDPAAAEPVELLDQHVRVDDDAVADRAGEPRMEDPRRDQVELELLAVADDRVAGVVAALKADHERCPLGEQVDDLALSLVAPLGPDDHCARHGG